MNQTRTTTLRVLFNSAPYRLGESERRQLLGACPRAEPIEIPSAVPLEACDGSEIDVLLTERIPRDLSAWPALRMVQLLSAGASQLRDHPIAATGIPVCTASGTHSVPIAEFVTGALLMLSHRMPERVEFKSSRQWPNRIGLAGQSVRGRTAGILGYGSIGRECARQLAALGMNVMCLKRDPATRRDAGFTAWPDTGDPAGDIPRRWFSPAELREMLPLCDVLVVTAPGTPETVGMIEQAELDLLPPGAKVMVVSRGGIVDEPALADALRRGRVAAAVVDCFAHEPLPANHVFFETPNLIMTPHVSGIFDGYWPAMIKLLGENLRRLDSGRPLLNCADRRLGY